MGVRAEVECELPAFGAECVDTLREPACIVERQVRPAEQVCLARELDRARPDLGCDGGSIASPEDKVRLAIPGVPVIPCAERIGIHRQEPGLVDEHVADLARARDLAVAELDPYTAPARPVRSGGHPFAHDAQRPIARNTTDRDGPHAMEFHRTRTAPGLEHEIHAPSVRNAFRERLERGIQIEARQRAS